MHTTLNYEIRAIKFNSDEYKSELELRNKVLRLPLGLNLYVEDLNGEVTQWHFGAFADVELIGVLILVPYHNGEIKMRQVAVDEKFQGKHIGKKMVEFAEKFASAQGFKKMILHARQSASPFYLKLGYKIVSDVFTEVTIPHLKMEKMLS